MHKFSQTERQAIIFLFCLIGYLNASTMKTLWSPVTDLGKPKHRLHYGLGWFVSSPAEIAKGNLSVGHTGISKITEYEYVMFQAKTI